MPDEKVCDGPLEQPILLAFGCGSDRDSDVPMISNIVIGIVIAWSIIKGLERLADLLGSNHDTENRKP